MNEVFEKIYRIIRLICPNRHIRLFFHSILYYIDCVPFIWWVLLGAVGIVVFLVQKDIFGKEPKYSKRFAALIFYVGAMLSVTIIFREKNSTVLYELTPFWSYKKAILERNFALVLENFNNTLLFIPVGFLFNSISNRKSIVLPLCLGFLISLFIEGMQLILRCGVCETDDILHNTLGAILGGVIYILIRKFIINRNKTKTLK